MLLNRRALLCTALAASALPGAALAQSAETGRVQAIVDQYGFNGVILKARRGETTFAGGFGVADAGAGRAAQPSDRFMIASISKWLTSAAVMRLVETGALALNETIGTWLPDYRADAGGAVTLRHLMNNTSGIPNGYNAAVEADPGLRSRDMPVAEAVERFCSGAPIFEPGERFDYAGSNWILVMAIMEAASGEAYESLMQRLVLHPLDMTQTAVMRPEFATALDAARAYEALDPPTLKMSSRPTYMAAAGGYVSTAGDLLAAARGVLGGRLLSASSLEDMTRVTVPEQHYALGGRMARLETSSGPRTAGWETGRTDGYRSVLGYCLEDGMAVVMLNNTDMPQPVMDQIALALLDARFA